MASAQCSQCGRPEDSRSLSVCPVCRGCFCPECMPRHQMQCGCLSPMTLAVDPL